MDSIKIKNLPKTLRPREKALMYGIESLSNRELLALFIRTGTKTKSALDLADEILLLSDNFKKFHLLKYQDFCQVSGIKEAKALQLIAVLELAQRIYKEEVFSSSSIDHPKKIIKWLKASLSYREQEQFLVLFLNHRLKLIQGKTLFTGTLDRSLVHPRDIYREAVRLNAAALILVHNHPGGSLEPSHADIETTKKLVSVGFEIGIRVLDHLIVSFGDYHSIRSSHAYIFEE